VNIKQNGSDYMEKEIKVTPLYYDYVLDNDYQVVVEVGGRFSGKSHNEQVRLVSNLASKEDYKLLVIEDLETGMADGFHAGLRDRIEEFEQTTAYNPRSRTAHIKNKINNNQTLFRGYATDQQRLNVKKLSGITEILVEEGEWMDYDSFISLLQQLRGGNAADRKLTILMNPVNPDCFVNKLLIETKPDKVLEYFKGTKRPKIFERHIKTTFVFDDKNVVKTIVVLVILSTHYDNPFLTLDQRATIEQLKETDPDKYLQLGEARFIRSSNTFFRDFDRNVHVIEPFIIPDGWNRYATTDYGLDMEATLWIALDYEGNGYVYKESHQPDLIISEACEEILEVNGGDKIYTRYGPPDLMARNKTNGKTTWELFNENGWSLYQSDNKREPGCLSMKEWLRIVETRDKEGNTIKTSRLKFFNNCTNIIRTLPQLITDKSNANRYATLSSELETKLPNYHDLTHAPDALRYFCSMHECIPLKPVNQINVKDAFFGTKRRVKDDSMCGDVF